MPALREFRRMHLARNLARHAQALLDLAIGIGMLIPQSRHALRREHDFTLPRRTREQQGIAMRDNNPASRQLDPPASGPAGIMIAGKKHHLHPFIDAQRLELI